VIRYNVKHSTLQIDGAGAEDAHFVGDIAVLTEEQWGGARGAPKLVCHCCTKSVVLMAYTLLCIVEM